MNFHVIFLSLLSSLQNIYHFMSLHHDSHTTKKCKRIYTMCDCYDFPLFLTSNFALCSKLNIFPHVKSEIQNHFLTKLFMQAHDFSRFFSFNFFFHFSPPLHSIKIAFVWWWRNAKTLSSLEFRYSHLMSCSILFKFISGSRILYHHQYEKKNWMMEFKRDRLWARDERGWKTIGHTIAAMGWVLGGFDKVWRVRTGWIKITRAFFLVRVKKISASTPEEIVCFLSLNILLIA